MILEIASGFAKKMIFSRENPRRAEEKRRVLVDKSTFLCYDKRVKIGPKKRKNGGFGYGA